MPCFVDKFDVDGDFPSEHGDAVFVADSLGESVDGHFGDDGIGGEFFDGNHRSPPYSVHAVGVVGGAVIYIYFICAGFDFAGDEGVG